jgi:hypothetical protein
VSVQERLIRYRPFCDTPPISVERLKPTVAELERRGVMFTHPPHRTRRWTTTPWMASFKDPDDHTLAVMQEAPKGCRPGA